MHNILMLFLLVNEIGRDIIVELIQSHLEGREISGKTKLGNSDLVYGVNE